MYPAQWHAMRSFTRDKSVTQQRLSRGIVRRIARYARPYRLDLAIFLTLTALSAVIAVAVPLLLQTIIDRGILPKNMAVVLWVAGTVAALALVRAENQRVATESAAPTRASAATTPAIHSTTAVSPGRMPSSMMRCSSSGTATAITADSAVSVRKMTRSRR